MAGNTCVPEVSTISTVWIRPSANKVQVTAVVDVASFRSLVVFVVVEWRWNQNSTRVYLLTWSFDVVSMVVFYSRFVSWNKHPLHKLGNEGGFTYSPTSHKDNPMRFTNFHGSGSGSVTRLLRIRMRTMCRTRRSLSQVSIDRSWVFFFLLFSRRSACIH